MLEEITQENINLFHSLFQGRTDVYAKYWQSPKSSKCGFAPVYTLNNKAEPLTDSVIKDHLLGNCVIGIYPLLKNNTTHFLAIDFDGEGWFYESVSVINLSAKYGLPTYLERSKSGHGGHVWFFFVSPIPSWKARRLGKFLLAKASLTRKKSFDRLFPSQDELKPQGLGNLISLPLSGRYLNQGNTSFVDSNCLAHEDQWAYLKTIKKVAEDQINVVLDSDITNHNVATDGNQNNQTPPEEPPADLKESDSLEDNEPEVKTTQGPNAKLILGSQIFIPNTFLPDKLYKFLKKGLNLSNPAYYELQRRGYSTWKTPKFLRNIEVKDDGVYVPAGFLPQIQEFAKDNNLTLDTVSEQIVTHPLNFKSTLALRSGQQEIASRILKYDRAVLEAPPAFGKTIVALYCLKRRKQKTLIIVHTKVLMHQWEKQLRRWFSLKDGDIGLIGENKWQVGKLVTTASYQTLARRGVDEIKNEFGMVVVDECHHVPAKTFCEVVKNLASKYVLGLTATPVRRDQLEKLMLFYIGPIVSAKVHPNNTEVINADVSEITDHNSVTMTIVTRKTDFKPKKTVPDFSELASLLVNDSSRNQLIAQDVADALATGAKCLVLSERVEHSQILLEEIRKKIKGIQAATPDGRITKKKREQLQRRIQTENFKLLLATGKLIGEGFDWPQVTHLFLAFPFSWKGKLTQYIGRAQRKVPGKDQAFIYDYTDFDVPMLKVMYFKRLRAYRSLGIVKGKTAKESVPENQLPLF